MNVEVTVVIFVLLGAIALFISERVRSDFEFAWVGVPKDFIKFALPLNILIWLVACAIIPFVWPFSGV